jgi:hypothetical protein
MHSMRQRGCDIVASAVSAFLIMAVLTAATTILRDIVLRPHPIVHDVRVTGVSPLYVVRTPTLLSKQLPDAALYYHPNHEGDGVELPANIELVDLLDREDDSEETRKQKNWQRQRVPPGYELGARATNRVALYLSGSIDFSPLWDWNTKAIYISFIARFQSPSTSLNEVVFLDAVMRPVSPPASILRLAALRRQEREKRNSISSGAAVAALLSEEERQKLETYEKTLRSREHDHPSLYIDHIDRVLFMHESFKYFVDAFDNVTLPGGTVEVVLRYQVMSYSGWAPVREEVLGHQVKVHMPANVIPFGSHRPQV